MAALIAGGVEGGPSDGISLRVEMQLSPIVGQGEWAVVFGPIVTGRLSILEFGVGLDGMHAEDAEHGSIDGSGLLWRVGLGWPVAESWTVHVSAEAAPSHDAVAGLLAGSVSRRF